MPDSEEACIVIEEFEKVLCELGLQSKLTDLPIDTQNVLSDIYDYLGVFLNKHTQMR